MFIFRSILVITRIYPELSDLCLNYRTNRIIAKRHLVKPVLLDIIVQDYVNDTACKKRLFSDQNSYLHYIMITLEFSLE